METYNNIVLERLPKHLKRYVVAQRYERYTALDQALWRYVMRQNYSFLKDVAYYPYIPGLKKAGLSIATIPNLQDMNDSLKLIGWGAVTVDGFIPPAAFMEFQAHRVLVIAADIRQLEHIEYTPAPDIIHESSGHAPIIGEPDYATYLQYFGEVGTKALSSGKDFELYEAIRHLSILKEHATTTAVELAEAEKNLQIIQDNMGEPSEMALLSRLHWWTVEYGLIGDLHNPKIYGAGLLSSIGESASCMQEDVPKLAYGLNAIEYPYDITKPQPQLFVTPDFEHLKLVLDKFADTMAFRIGGKQSLDKAIDCKAVCTVEYSSGLQVSGVFKLANADKNLSYIQTQGPTALAVAGKQLEGHGIIYHSEGFGSPVGHLRGADCDLADFDEATLIQYGIVEGQQCSLNFASGIIVSGIVQKIVRQFGKIVLISFIGCEVYRSDREEVYFKPEWGTYDMAVGAEIVSVFAGAADKDAYDALEEHLDQDLSSIPAETEDVKLVNCHAAIRNLRDNGFDQKVWLEIFSQLGPENADHWLGLVELFEIARANDGGELTTQAEQRLLEFIILYPNLKKLIDDGLRVAKEEDLNNH
ncbi:aromatic amino acid hydroxylase [Sphingobacterium siyangense]|jgi:phenylalanine-4-hydroxylase|uniref:aromatic amino acid hydroxylase n=1 Tax=Sphingobacterium siyangense TaxID=459529 RepID=UPI0028B1863F|nr:aromatic amino acid hydroxylase [Sphingobacterium siyangense]